MKAANDNRHAGIRESPDLTHFTCVRCGVDAWMPLENANVMLQVHRELHDEQDNLESYIDDAPSGGPP